MAAPLAIALLLGGPAASASAHLSRGHAAAAASTAWTQQRQLPAAGVYEIRLSIASAPRVKREHVEVFVQRVERRSLSVTQTRAQVRVRLELDSKTLMVRVLGSRGVPRASASVQLVRRGTRQTASGSKIQSASTTSAHPIAFGAYVSGVPDYPSLLDDFTAEVRRTPAIVLWYRYWGEQLFNTHDLSAVDSRGAVPMVTWEPWNPDHTDVSLKGIAAGADDATINAAAQAAAAWRKPIFVRFAQEMNGDWFPWGLGVNGNTAAQYISAWRHIVTLFRADGASNVRWVWSPNEYDSGTPRFEQLYPGNAYVNWVALDGYNFGSTPDNSWQSFSQVFSASYAAMLQLTSKPLMIAETASVEQGGSKAAWITSALETQIPTSFPRIRAVVWFDKVYNGGLDWPVDSSSSSLAAFRAAVDSPLYGLSGASLEAIPTT